MEQKNTCTYVLLRDIKSAKKRLLFFDFMLLTHDDSLN